MKRMTKLLAVLAVGAVATAGVVGLAACGEKGETYEGDYHYSQTYGEKTTTYGIKVKVTVNDGKITKVERLEHDYVEATNLNGANKNWDDGANYNKEINNELKKFEGLSVDDVLAVEVVTDDAGVPVIASASNFKPYTVGDTNLLLTKSTQSSGRLILAVQDALEKIDA